MDNFFQTLRDIQKKERTSGTLSEIEDTFYDDASKYLNELLEIVNENPLSLETYSLREAQRITIEISERREFKIITSAITNVQKSHNLFKGLKENSQLYDEIPYNTTPEEEKLYKDIIDDIIKHREGLIKQIDSKPKKKETKIGFKSQQEDHIIEDAISESSGTALESNESNGENLLDIADVPIKNQQNQENIEDSQDNNQPKKKPTLDASQVAQMFGQAPDDTLLDENNNPVEEKSVKRNDNIMAPFEPPKVPQNDTVTLQNQDKNILENPQLQDEIPANPVNDELASDDSIDKQVVDDSTVEANQIQTTEMVEHDLHEDMADESFVEFIDDLSTDVLDEDERTYGPFNVGDMAMLPKSIAGILKNNNVINIL